MSACKGASVHSGVTFSWAKRWQADKRLIHTGDGNNIMYICVNTSIQCKNKNADSSQQMYPVWKWLSTVLCALEHVLIRYIEDAFKIIHLELDVNPYIRQTTKLDFILMA